jgi:SNF2 family DNA or RNA helicase
VLVLHGLDRKDHFDAVRDHDLILTTYPLLPRDGPMLLKHKFHCLILDEAQFIKNPRTAAAQRRASLHARHRLCLTGTPIENHLGELWSLFHFLMPGFLGDHSPSSGLSERPIEKTADNSRRGHSGAPREAISAASPQGGRRQGTARQDRDRPERRTHRRPARPLRKRPTRHAPTGPEEVKKKGFSRAHIVILDALLKLRQICCHPALLDLPVRQGRPGIGEARSAV